MSDENQKSKAIVIEKNTGSFVTVHPKEGDFGSIVKIWEDAHKKDECFTVLDIGNNLHRINSRRVIDIFQHDPRADGGEQPAKDSYLDNLDQE